MRRLTVSLLVLTLLGGGAAGGWWFLEGNRESPALRSQTLDDLTRLDVVERDDFPSPPQGFDDEVDHIARQLAGLMEVPTTLHHGRADASARQLLRSHVDDEFAARVREPVPKPGDPDSVATHYWGTYLAKDVDVTDHRVLARSWEATTTRLDGEPAVRVHLEEVHAYETGEGIVAVRRVLIAELTDVEAPWMLRWGYALRGVDPCAELVDGVLRPTGTELEGNIATVLLDLPLEENRHETEDRQTARECRSQA